MAKKENNELVNRNQAFLIYQDDNGIARVNVRFEGEQNPERTHIKFLIVQQGFSADWRCCNTKATMTGLSGN